jgi:multimeric flavodoxin WrbA
VDCSNYESCLQQDDGNWVLQKFCEADGIILATPVYYYDISAWLKIFIDRNYFFYRYGKKCRAKVAGMIVVAGGARIEDTLHTLNRFVNTSHLDIPKSNRLVVTGYASGPGDVKNNSKLITEAKQLGINMARVLGGNTGSSL